MREIYDAIAIRLRDENPFAVATLVATRNSAPAPIGTSLVVDSDGAITGNIGAGCHESEIVDAARTALRDTTDRTLEFDMSDELLDGSACGASLTVVVWRPPKEFASIADRVSSGSDAVTFLCGGHLLHIPRKRRLVIVGATDLASHLTRAARAVDFHVTVVDPRPAFATQRRHPDSDDLIVGWPDDVLLALLEHADAVVALAHDVKIDVPAIRCALASTIPYIGALGSRRSQLVRREALSAFGYDQAVLDRVRGPVGLDLGAVTNAQIACSILAEILSVLNGRSGRPLRDTTGAIANV
ncbi:MAG: XdhC family protein [Candidatus Tumulicola sp.]